MHIIINSESRNMLVFSGIERYICLSENKTVEVSGSAAAILSTLIRHILLLGLSRPYLAVDLHRARSLLKYMSFLVADRSENGFYSLEWIKSSQRFSGLFLLALAGAWECDFNKDRDYFNSRRFRFTPRKWCT